MHLSSDVQIPDGLLAAMTLLNEKPHQGVQTWNPAPHQGISEANCTAAIGLRVSAQLNPIWPRYTGKERDTESGLDYFGARYYASNMGRWMSPDWAAKAEPVPYANLDDPQSLNLYAYVGNNPLSKADKDGHCWPVCTAILGAGLGALAEAGTEYLKGEKLNPYKIGAAAIAGGVTGAIAGPIGDAVELGVVAKVGGQLAANLIGGAVERKLNGEKALDPKAALADAAGAAATGKVAKGLEKQLASEVVKKVSGAAIEVTGDAAKNLLTAKPEEHKQEAPKDKKTPGSN